MKTIVTLAAAALLLAACAGTTPSPNPLPVPPAVQNACAVIGWAEPLAEQYFTASPALQKLLADAKVALASCSAGNATDAIVEVAQALYDYFTAKGIRPPVGMRRPAR